MRHIIRKAMHNELFESLIAVLIFLLLLINGCAVNEAYSGSPLSKYDTTKSEVSQPANVGNLNPGYDTSKAGAIETANDGKLNSELILKGQQLRKPVSSADYKIGPDDLLEIDVFQVPELKTLVRVSARGYIKLILLDSIKASGITVSELETLISHKLEKFMKDPAVSVFVREYRSQQISVLGSVKDPKVFYVTGQKYLLDMISMAGGLTPDAGTVCLIQPSSDSGLQESAKMEKVVVDLNELLLNGRADLNVPVYSGDIIQVPRSGIFFVDGAVNSPGEYPLKNKTTMVQAISLAKGLKFEAIPSEVKIYRVDGNGERVTVTANYEAILAGNNPDIELKDKDIILVGKSGFRSLIKGITGALNFGIFRLGTGF